MNSHDPLKTSLDDLVPLAEVEPDWDDVLRRAAPERRRKRFRDRRRPLVLGLATAVVAVLAIALIDPFANDEEGILDRALAAVGDGPVVHVVTRLPVKGTIVDLHTGKRRVKSAERETWFDPSRGIRTTLSFDGKLLNAYAAPIGPRLRLNAARDSIEVFTRDYRAALRSGRARVLGQAEVAGMAVYWIRQESGPRVTRPGPCTRANCQDVAIDRSSYKPVFLRLRPGRNDDLERILTVESLPAGTGTIPGRPRGRRSSYTRIEPRRSSATLAERTLNGRFVYPGREIGRLRLWRMTAIGMRSYEHSGKMKRPRFFSPEIAVRMVYGTTADMESKRHFRSWDPVLLISEARKDTPAGDVAVDHPRGSVFPHAPPGYIPPEGSLLLADEGRLAVLRHRGLVIKIAGSSARLVQAGVRAVRR